MFCKSGILIFTFAENNYSIYAHTMLIKTPLLHQNLVPVSCFFCAAADVGHLSSGSSAFSKFSLNIWKFSVHILLKPGLENFEHYFVSV